MSDSPSSISSLGAPWVDTHSSSMAFVRVVSNLSGMSLPACQQVHLAVIWKMIRLFEEQAANHLRIERVCHLHVARVGRARIGPLSAYAARLGDLWQHVEHTVCNAAPLKHPPHGVVGSMPPPDAQFSQGEPKGSSPINAEESHFADNVEVGPVFGALRLAACISVRLADSLL